MIKMEPIVLFLPKVFLASLWVCLAAQAQVLPGTQPLTTEGDLARQMVDGMHRFLDRETAAALARREGLWRRDYSSREAYEKSIAPNRERFRKMIGAVDERISGVDLVFERNSPVAKGPEYEVHAVHWPVFMGVDGEGLLLEPRRPPVARVVALPDADWSPEMLVGLTPGVPPTKQVARRLAENGCQVLIPVLIDRKDTWSGNPRIRLTNQPHREFIYRMAYEMGRHIIGYEVQKVLAAVDWFARQNPRVPIGVLGHGEGGLLALYSAAVDTRIDAALVSGYFMPREQLWQEPIYRNVWALLTEFGDSDLAGMIAPRALAVDASGYPEIEGPPPESRARRGAAPGRLAMPDLEEVRIEFQRAKTHFDALGVGQRISLAESTESALPSFWRGLGQKVSLKRAGRPPQAPRGLSDPQPRLRRQLEQLIEFTQAVVRRSDLARQQFFSRADASSINAWQQSTKWYRRYLWEEVIGRFPDPSEPMMAHTRQIYDEAHWTGYEVVLPVWPDVFAYGILLLPKDLRPGERRPVVVCQHGLEGRPKELIRSEDPGTEVTYQHYAARLADRGFIVYAPQNPYIFGNHFRQLQRKANPIKKTLFSFILGQHQRLLDWLSSQPFVDPARIAFYGLSYGGKTAVRVPPLLDKYALSICSGDFNEWVWKITSVEHAFSYMFTQEYEMLEFDLGNTFNYAEVVGLMAPRPFMVERGHKDGVSIDEWVAYEYAKVRRFYTFLGIPEKTEIEFFNGPHQIHGIGTFRFLHRHLNWPEPKQ